MNNVNLVIFPASDMPKSTRFFATLLGAEPYAESGYYVGFKAGDTEIGLVPKAMHGSAGALAFVTVSDINAALATLIAGGAEKVQDVRDVANGLLVATVKDLDGTVVGLRQFPSS